MTTPYRSARRATRTAVKLGLALVAALALSPALAQDAANDALAADPAREATPRAGAFSYRRGPDGGVALRGMRFDPREGGFRSALGDRFDRGAGRWRAPGGAEGETPPRDAFARWLEADPDAGPLVPGLVGRLADGTSVDLVFYVGAPEDGGTEVATLSFVAGADDAPAFRSEVRAAAEGATHVVVDVLGRVVALPGASPAGAAE